MHGETAETNKQRWARVEASLDKQTPKCAGCAHLNGVKLAACGTNRMTAPTWGRCEEYEGGSDAD